MLTLPCVIVNFKTYNVDAVLLARTISVTENVYACPQLTDLKEVSHICKTLAQHVDPYTPGQHTGSVLPEKILEAGAFGSLINHSEDRMDFDKIKESVKRLKKLSLASVVCARDLNEVKQLKKFMPTAIAVEPPELIGGKVSVSTADPDLIKSACKQYKTVLVGAGIHSKKDVETAMKLGAKGVLVASGVVLSGNPEKSVQQMIEVFDGG